MKNKTLSLTITLALVVPMMLFALWALPTHAASRQTTQADIQLNSSPAFPSSTYTVTNLNASGAGSLLDAVNQANANAGADMINFNVSGTIVLTTTLVISDDVTIDGSGQVITVSGNNLHRVFTINAGVNATIQALTIANGYGPDCGGYHCGSGMYNLGNLTVTNSTLVSNTADYGAAIDNGLTLNVMNSTFINNTTTAGGAGIFNSGAGAVSNVTNSTFVNNNAGTSGGAIDSSAIVTATNNTFYGNSAAGGAAFWSNNSLTLRNNLIANSLGGGNCSIGGTVNIDSHTLADDNTCGSATVVTTTQLALQPLANNGGNTQTMALGFGSVAIDAANDGNCPSADQRGVPRPQGTHCDVGAYESNTQLGPHFIVNHTTDTNDGSCDALVVGITDCTLREAINASNAYSGTPTITFGIPVTDTGCVGTACTIVLNSTLPAVSHDVTIDGSGHTITVSTSGSFGVLTINGGVNATINALTIANSGCPVCTGLGIFNNSGTLTVSNSIFSGNSTGIGGGIYNSSGTVNVTNSVFANNIAGFGGGIYNDSGAVTVANSAFSGNISASGGGIYNSSGTLTVTNSIFSSNSSVSSGGGGIDNNSGTLNITDSQFTNNSASGSSATGGGIYNNSGAVNVTNSAFAVNSAASSGGSISNSSRLTVTNSTFSSNTSSYGGGIYNNVCITCPFGTLTVINSTFSSNTSSFGGAIYNSSPALVTLIVLNGTFSGNQASSGGGIYNRGTTTLKNTIVANSPSGGDCVNIGTLTANSYNLADGNSCDSATQKTLAQIKLGPLANNGGATQTFALLPGSVAINAADDAECPATDQRGVPRPYGAHCDVGAYEFFGGLFLPIILHP